MHNAVHALTMHGPIGWFPCPTPALPAATKPIAGAKQRPTGGYGAIQAHAGNITRALEPLSLPGRCRC